MKRTLCIIAAALLMVGALSVLLVAPGTSEAESSMTIEDGVLVGYAISNNDTSVNIPSTVREIGDEVFMNAKSLEAVGIPSSVKKIGKRAFYGCSGLTHITIQNGTESIGESAFAMCSRLSLISLPTTLTEVGDGAFAGDVALNSVVMATPNPYFFLNESVLYNMNSTRLLSYIAGKTEEDFIMPYSVKRIQPYAFWGSEHLKSVYVSNGVETIDSFAFCNAAGLESIYIPNSVKSIDAYAFRDCRNLKYVAIENGACDIDPSAFDGCAEGLAPEFGVNKSAFRTNAGRFAVKKTSSGNKIVSGNDAKKINDKQSKEEKTEKDEKDQGDAKSVGTVENGGSLVVNSVWGVKAPYKPIDREHPKGILGAGKIVGGSAFIIPTDSYNDVKTKQGVSNNVVVNSASYERDVSDESLSDNAVPEESVSEDSVSDDNITDDSVSDDSISDESLSDNTVSEDTID